MASAEKRYVEKEVTKIEKVEDGVMLELTKDEAETLFAICGLIGGSPYDTRRRFIDQIGFALRKAGVTKLNHYAGDSLMDGEVKFVNTLGNRVEDNNPGYFDNNTRI